MTCTFKICAIHCKLSMSTSITRYSFLPSNPSVNPRLATSPGVTTEFPSYLRQCSVTSVYHWCGKEGSLLNYAQAEKLLLSHCPTYCTCLGHVMPAPGQKCPVPPPSGPDYSNSGLCLFPRGPVGGAQDPEPLTGRVPI